MAAHRGRKGSTNSVFRGRLTARHKKALALVAAEKTQTEAARVVGYHPKWLNAIIQTSKEAQDYLKESRERIVAKHRMLVEASINESLKAIFADELGLCEEERGKLAISRAAALQLGYNPVVARIAALTDVEDAKVTPPIDLRMNVIAMLKDPVVARLVMNAAHEAAARGLLVKPKEPAAPA